jgi:uncharacterized protein YndB with AHSA1/START domain
MMLTSLIHHISIAAPAETIYRALTTEEGIECAKSHPPNAVTGA